MPPDHEPQMEWPRLAGMGLEFAASVGVFMLIGWWIDRHWQIEGHKALLTCTVLGVIGGMYNFIRQAVAALRQSEREARERRSRRHDVPADEQDKKD